jgi:hypothetical protein
MQTLLTDSRGGREERRGAPAPKHMWPLAGTFLIHKERPTELMELGRRGYSHLIIVEKNNGATVPSQGNSFALFVLGKSLLQPRPPQASANTHSQTSPRQPNVDFHQLRISIATRLSSPIMSCNERDMSTSDPSLMGLSKRVEA